MFSIGCTILMIWKSITRYVHVWGRKELIGNTIKFLCVKIKLKSLTFYVRNIPCQIKVENGFEIVLEDSFVHDPIRLYWDGWIEISHS